MEQFAVLIPMTKIYARPAWTVIFLKCAASHSGMILYWESILLLLTSDELAIVIWWCSNLMCATLKNCFRFRSWECTILRATCRIILENGRLLQHVSVQKILTADNRGDRWSALWFIRGRAFLWRSSIVRTSTFGNGKRPWPPRPRAWMRQKQRLMDCTYTT